MSFSLVDNAPFSYRDGSPVSNDPGYHPHISTRFLNRGEAKCPEQLPELYRIRSECCGCTACMAVCSVEAISMLPDEEGFEYPTVDAALCIGCSKCTEICSFKERLVH